MKTKITLETCQNNFGSQLLFFICFLFSLNSFSQKIQTSLTETWKSEAWENLSQTFYTYDSNTFLIRDLTQGWETVWKDNSQTNYTNNADGTAQQSISQLWNTESNVWENAQRTTYTYTASKNVLSSESEIWFDPDWMSFLKQINTYDSSDYLINNLSQTYDFITPWKNANQTIYSNNADGTVNQVVSQTWNINAWNNTNRITYTYSGSKPVSSLSENWNGTMWENFSRDTYNYDGSGYLIYALSEDWIANAWKNDTQSFITNYVDGSPYQIIGQDWDDTSLTWKNASRITLTYTSLGVDEPVFENSIAVYPNPAHNKITIKTNGNSVGMKYLITDQLGRQLINGKIIDVETVIDIDQLATGVYFIQMGQNKNQTIKMIKQ